MRERERERERERNVTHGNHQNEIKSYIGLQKDTSPKDRRSKVTVNYNDLTKQIPKYLILLTQAIGLPPICN